MFILLYLHSPVTCFLSNSAKKLLIFFLLHQVKNVSGDPEVMVNDLNPNVWGSREYVDQLDHNSPLYLPG